MGSVGNKYRVHEVAKDFGVPTKQITEILTKYAETPKNHMQVLEDRELSLIFEYLTQHNQVSGIQVIFAEGAKPAEKKQQPAAKPAEKKPEGKGESRSAKQETKPVSRVPQTKVVDTRKATAVNLDKYDEKLQDMAEGRTGGGRRAQQQTQGRQAQSKPQVVPGQIGRGRPFGTAHDSVEMLQANASMLERSKIRVKSTRRSISQIYPEQKQKNACF